jgi:flagellar hook-length control protein FliK
VIPPPIPVEETGTSVTTPAGAEPLSDAGEVPTPVSDGEVQTDKEGEQATGGSTVSETGEHADPQQLVSSESTTPVSSSSEQTAATPAEVPAEGLPGTISAAASPVVAGADEREPDTSGSRSTTNRRRLERAESIAQRLGGAADTAAGAVSTDADVTPSRSLTPEAGGHPGAAPTSGGSTSQPGTPALTPGVPAAGGPIGELGEAGLGRLSGGPTRSRLSELADIASTVIRVTAREGKAAARITLRPAELGDVEIRLRYHAGGVSADVVADSPQAAQTLSQAVGELRRSLETQGLVVHWLDVRTGDDGRRAWQEAWHPGQGEARGRRDPLEELDELRSPTPVDAAALPGTGGSVDVLV